MAWMRFLMVLLCLVPASGFTVCAQSTLTNLEAYQTLALRCLTSVPDTTSTLLLDAPSLMPYLRTALTEAWQRDGHTLYLSDTSFSAAAQAAPRLTYALEEAHVGYDRARRKHLNRTVTLALRYTLTAADGRLLGEDRCRETFTDTIRRAGRPALESKTFSETQGEIPRAGWMRRYFEPAVLATATAITVYLFFNLRSDRSGDGV